MDSDGRSHARQGGPARVREMEARAKRKELINTNREGNVRKKKVPKKKGNAERGAADCAEHGIGGQLSNGTATGGAKG